MYIKHVHLFPLRIVLSVLQCEQGSWEHLFIFGIYSLTRSTTSLWPCLSASYGGDCKALGDTDVHIYCHEDFEVEINYKAQRMVYFYLFIYFFHLHTVLNCYPSAVKGWCGIVVSPPGGWAAWTSRFLNAVTWEWGYKGCSNWNHRYMY